MSEYDLAWINCDNEIRANPDYVHDNNWLAGFIAKKYWGDVSKVEHFALVLRKQYQELGQRDKCPQCHANLRCPDDWDYCPYCGAYLPNVMHISADTDSEIMREYRALTGENMPPEKQAEIQTGFYVKLWIKRQ